MQKVAIDQIKLDNKYIRLNSDVDALMKSLDTIGLIHPITVDKNYNLLAGGRRYSAAVELGWKEIAVEVVDRHELEQELISIDENLVRTPLNRLELEKCLNRGREIYEKLNPQANKVEVKQKELTPEQKKEEKQKEEEDQTSFAAITAEKTGLSKSSIKQAIQRDALSSKAIKKARQDGILNASQTNEIIKLDKSEQEEILEIVKERPTREIKKIVAVAKEKGLSQALKEAQKMVPLPREFKDLKASVAKTNKVLAKIMLEDINYSGPEQEKIWQDLRALEDKLQTFFDLRDGHKHIVADDNESAQLH